jgi:hypothetical protein
VEEQRQGRMLLNYEQSKEDLAGRIRTYQGLVEQLSGTESRVSAADQVFFFLIFLRIGLAF